jgi:hypothetical protein
MYYSFPNTSDHVRDIMDLHASDQRQDKRWNIAKIGALFCFVLAGGILIASLLLPSAPQGGSENGLAASLSAPVH